MFLAGLLEPDLLEQVLCLQNTTYSLVLCASTGSHSLCPANYIILC